MRKAIATAQIVVGTMLIVVTLCLSMPYARHDLLQTAASFMGPIVSLMAGVILLRHTRTRTKWAGTKWGYFAGACLFTVLQAFVLSTHYQQISDDGVAYWIFVTLSSFYVALPACLLGMLVGWICDLIRMKRSKKGVMVTGDPQRGSTAADP